MTRLSSLLVAFYLFCLVPMLAAAPAGADGWRVESPRKEVQPQAFVRQDKEGPILAMRANARPSTHGVWAKTFEIEGGQHYEWQSRRRFIGKGIPRRSAMVKISWVFQGS